jgi:hypothetical protein
MIIIIKGFWKLVYVCRRVLSLSFRNFAKMMSRYFIYTPDKEEI